MSTRSRPTTWRTVAASVMVLLMVGVVLNPLSHTTWLPEKTVIQPTSGSWSGYEQPWAQYARTPTHNQTVPDHGPDGGPGEGSITDVSTLGTLENPTINWQVFSGQSESDAYGSVIGNFSASISASATRDQDRGRLHPLVERISIDAARPIRRSPDPLPHLLDLQRTRR